MKKPLTFILLILTCFSLSGQEIKETNTDLILKKATELYKSGETERTLRYTRRGLELAPEYHDIRILQVRTLWALEKRMEADKDLFYLLEKASGYIEVKPLALQRINKAATTAEGLEYLHRLESVYPEEIAIQIAKAQLLLEEDRKKEARALAGYYISSSKLSGEQRYVLQQILNRTVSQEIGLSYQHISFSDEYSRNDSWNNGSLEYQHNFGRTPVLARVSYTDRSYDQSLLYELEAYPVISNRFYLYTNLGVSEGTLFPDFRSSVSLYYNFATAFEGEIGGRLLNFQGKGHATAIAGISLYSGKFLFNARGFLGPVRQNKLVQNYQANARYYLNMADNYLFARLGSGISPDERVIYTQVQENPSLESYYSSLGIRHLFWSQHILQLEGGLLFQEITRERNGEQFQMSLSYRIRL